MMEYTFRVSNSKFKNSKLFLLPSEKRYTLKGKNLLPLGANSFLSEQTPFQKVTDMQETNRSSQKVSRCKICQKKIPGTVLTSVLVFFLLTALRLVPVFLSPIYQSR